MVIMTQLEILQTVYFTNASNQSEKADAKINKKLAYMCQGTCKIQKDLTLAIFFFEMLVVNHHVVKNAWSLSN